MQKALNTLLFTLPVVSPCPFASNEAAAPNDAIHQPHLRRRLTHLTENPDTEKKFNAIINRRAHNRRSLQTTCVSEATYDAIDEDIVDLSLAFADNKSRAHFLGGIVRLAAHDFVSCTVHHFLACTGNTSCILMYVLSYVFSFHSQPPRWTSTNVLWMHQWELMDASTFLIHPTQDCLKIFGAMTVN